MFDNVSKSQSQSENVVLDTICDTARGFVDGLVEKPLNGLIQMWNQATNYDLPELNVVDTDETSKGTQVGRFLGGLTGFVLVHRGIGSGLAKFGMEAGIGRSALQAGLSGGVMQALNPIADSDNFWAEKAKTCLIAAGTYGTLGGAAHAMSAGLPAATTLGRQVLRGAAVGNTAGFCGGVMNTALTDILYQRRFDFWRDTRNLTQYAFFGTAIGALGGLRIGTTEAATRGTADPNFSYRLEMQKRNMGPELLRYFAGKEALGP